MKKRLLSVALAISMIASLLMVGITGPVSAVKDTASTLVSADYDRAIDLSKGEITPAVNLTFDGDTPYGIPFGRYSSDSRVGYENGSYKLVGPGGNGYWVFFGKNATVGQNTVHYSGGTANDTHATAVADLYQLEQGKTYIVSFDVKAIKGSTVNTSNAIIYGTSANPSTSNGAANTNNITVSSASGFTLEYKVNGVAQEAGTVLSVDSDWQTATVTFTAKAAGKFGICSKLSGTDIYIDNVKIYDHDAYYDSKFQNRLTFDNGGLGVKRYVKNFAIANENGNGYCIVDDTNNSTGSAYFASCENSAMYSVSSGEYKTATGLGTVANAHKKMFKFESGHSYEVTFKYRYDSTATEKANTALVLRLMADPAGADHVADDLLRTNSWAKDIVCSDISTPNQLGLGVWQEVKVTFTVKTKDETSGYAKIRPSSSGDVSATHPDEYNLTIDKTGAYFGIKCIGQRVHIDDYNVRELVNYQVIYLETTNVSHDMEQDELATNSSGSIGSHFMRNDNKGATFTDSKDGHGKVLEFDANGSRGTFGDSNVFVRGKKYYISFDAKSTDGASKYMWLIFANLANNSNNYTGSQGTPRYILSNKDGGNNGTFSTVSNMFEFYINGQSVTKANFKISGEWQHFGMIVDFTNEVLNTEFATNHTNGTGFFNEAKYFYFGISNSQYDNFKITSVDAMPDAVPTSEISYVSKEISHDMETRDGFVESVRYKAHFVNSYDEKYGQVIEITAGGKRVTFNDSNIITSGKKYYISFDAKTTNNTERFMWLIISNLDSTDTPRFIVSDTTHQNKTDGSEDNKGATNLAIAENGNAFKYYIDGEEVVRDKFKISKDWRKYTLVIDTSDPELLAKAAATSGDKQISGLFDTTKYFYFGCENAWFDNFRMVEVSEATSTVSSKKSIYDTEVSCREESTTANGDYVSAGLRFKSKLPNGIVAEADEIGFVAAPSSLAKKTTDWYKLENGVNQVARTAIVKDDIRNYVYATDGDNTYYQLVFTGLSDENGKTAYNRRFSAVMYTKLGNEYKYYPLGEASYYQVGGITHVFNFDEKSLDVDTIASLDYKIVYNAEDYTSWVLKNQIDKLKQTMNNKGFGIEELDLRADTTLDAGDYEIVIGNTNRGTVGDASVLSNINRYAIRISGSKIYVLGGSTYALQSAVYELETMILAGKITEKEGSYLDTAIINATSEYKLVWQSEFDDPNTITYDSNNMASIKNWWVDPIGVNSETSQTKIYQSQAFLVSDRETVVWDNKGYLVLRAVRKDDSTLKYEDREDWSGNENLKYKQQGGIHCSTMEFNYGYVEMRAKIPDGKGLYSSFWLNGLYNGTTPEVEIDIFESGGRLSEFVPNIHWWKLDTVRNQCSEKNKPFFTALNDVRVKFIKEGSVSYNTGTPTSTNNIDAVNTWVSNYGNYNVFYPKPSNANKTMKFESNALFDKWHTVGLLWTDEVMEFYCDGVLYHSRDIKDFKYPDGTHAFDNQFENIIGGFNLGWNTRQENIDESTMSWDENRYLNYIIDYFRLYQIDKNWRPCTDYK